MQKLLMLSLVVGSMSLFAADNPQILQVELNRAYLPYGFDSNDNVQIAVAGVFSDTCYKVGPTEFKVVPDKKTIEVKQMAYHYEGTCFPIVEPFSQFVSLGILGKGDYKITDALTKKELGILPIQLATRPEPDDFLYASVSDAYIQYENSFTPQKLTITGEFSDRCTVYKRTIMNYYKDVIVVQPIAERNVAKGRDCRPNKTRFSVLVPLRQGLKSGFLLHVRSMNGQSINKFVDIN